MKSIKIFCLSLTLLMGVSACDNGFDELNTNTVNPTSLDPAFLLNNAVINASFGGNTLIYEIGIVQQIITPNSGVLTGANFNQDNRDGTVQLWQNYYRNVLRNTRDAISIGSKAPDRQNLVNMARIVQAFAFMVLTDAYGDIPYTQGGKGFLDQTFFPVYDSQETIYADLIKELTEASAALDPAGRVETADVLYAGNIARWKKSVILYY